MLVGTVVNNGILYVDTVNQYRTSMDMKTALIEAGATSSAPDPDDDADDDCSYDSDGSGIWRKRRDDAGTGFGRRRRTDSIYHFIPIDASGLL